MYMFNINTSVIMKSLMNYSKLAFITLVASSLFVACSDEISENTIDTQYIANVGNIKNAGQAVDLGLPSGTKWASMNVGATSESDNGILFNWGDITGNQVNPTTATSYKDVTGLTSEAALFEKYKGAEKSAYIFDTTNVYKESFSLSDYLLTQIDSIREARFDSVKTKYADSKLDFVVNADQSSYDIFVNKIDSTLVYYFESTQGGFSIDKGANISGAPAYNIIADANLDAATANWGNNWRMPTKEEFQELLNLCKWEFTGNGYKVTSKQEGNNNSIFLPAAGKLLSGSVIHVGEFGSYWSSTPHHDYEASSVKFWGDSALVMSSDSYDDGLSVRVVIEVSKL